MEQKETEKIKFKDLSFLLKFGMVAAIFDGIVYSAGMIIGLLEVLFYA